MHLYKGIMTNSVLFSVGSPIIVPNICDFVAVVVHL